MCEELSGKPDVVHDQEQLNLGGARQMVLDLVQLIEMEDMLDDRLGRNDEDE